MNHYEVIVWIVTHLLLWIWCACASYELTRAWWLNDGLRWTNSERVLAIVTGTLLAPIMLAVSVIIYANGRLTVKCPWWDKEASW